MASESAIRADCSQAFVILQELSPAGALSPFQTMPGVLSAPDKLPRRWSWADNRSRYQADQTSHMTGEHDRRSNVIWQQHLKREIIGLRDESVNLFMPET